jgi:hypothetical protein
MCAFRDGGCAALLRTDIVMSLYNEHCRVPNESSHVNLTANVFADDQNLLRSLSSSLRPLRKRNINVWISAFKKNESAAECVGTCSGSEIALFKSVSISALMPSRFCLHLQLS